MELGIMLKTFEFVITFGAVKKQEYRGLQQECRCLQDPTEHEVHPASGARSHHADFV